MKRRKFIKDITVAGGATAVAASTFPAPAIAQGKIRWNAVSAFGKAGLLGQALEEFTKFVSTASDGKLTIKAYHAGELVKPFEAMDAVQTGAAQINDFRHEREIFFGGQVVQISHGVVVVFEVVTADVVPSTVEQNADPDATTGSRNNGFQW